MGDPIICAKPLLSTMHTIVCAMTNTVVAKSASLFNTRATPRSPTCSNTQQHSAKREHAATPTYFDNVSFGKENVLGLQVSV